jgi:hypothetical protein
VSIVHQKARQIVASPIEDETDETDENCRLHTASRAC